MKKNILAIAIASAVAAPVAMADAPTVYGQINVAIDSVDIANDANETTGMDVVSRNSRLGFKGSEDLGNGLKAVYQYEIQMDPVNKDGDWNMRNSFVGLSGGFGTVVTGRHDTPLRMIQPSDGFADSKFAGNNTSNFNGGLAGEDRLNEVVAYMSPDFNGIKFAVALTGQDSLAEAGDDQALTNATSMNVTYGSKKSGIFAAAAMTNGNGINDRTRATVQYNEAGLLASFMYNDEADIGTSMTVGAAYKMGKITPRAKVSMVSYDFSTTNVEYKEDSMNMAVGVDYHLGKKTRIYAEYATLDDKNVAGYDIADEDDADWIGDSTVMSVGLFHKF